MAGDQLLFYAGTVMVLGFFVNLTLIMGTNRLSGFPPGIKRGILAAALGGIYSGAAVCATLQFLGDAPWRIAAMILTGAVAFGCNFSGLRRGAVYSLLCLALDGIASGTGTRGMGGTCVCAMLLWLLCGIGSRRWADGNELLPVEFKWKGNRLQFTALRDTGNTLRDPITGESVLVCSPDIGEVLLGIPGEAFADPVKTLMEDTVPGLRLLPFRTVGQSDGLMLAIRIKGVKIGNRITDSLVAFAPCEIGKAEGYQMLTGGF